MEVEITKMSSKGQVVIPQKARKEARIDEGSIFAVTAKKDTIILKKLAMPSKQKLIEELTNIAKEGRRTLERKGLKESDISEIIQTRRKE